MAAPQDPISPGSSAAQTWKLLTVARIKPLGEGATASVIKADDSSVVVHRDPTEVADDDEEDAPGGTAAFALDKVCGPEAPQEEVYGLLKPVEPQRARSASYGARRRQPKSKMKASMSVIR